MAFERLLLVVISAFALAGCATDRGQFPLRDPLWRDPDRRVFQRIPDEYFSPFVWDAADHTVFRPIPRFFALDPAGESINVNALDEVPDSSWFQNRSGRHGMSVEAVVRGACETTLPDSKGPWTIKAAKPNGFNPGFFIKANDGRRYLMKFDGRTEGPRPTAADVISTRFFHAAGYFVPCNRIVHFERSILRIDPEAKSESASGEEIALRESDVDLVFSKALRLADGRYRASLSLFIEGKPIGPWTYQGRRDDDPNDVVNHEDRRELRGMEVLAAWLAYTDSREQNTMASFIARDGWGYVRHYMLDVGNSFGPVWEPPMLGRRIGHAYYLDVPYMLEDLATFGVIQRPWDTLRLGPTQAVFGYYDVEHFDPDRFRTGYPNPAFIRKSERDSAWMARIIARLSPEHVRAIVETGELAPHYRERLIEILLGRRRKILRRYLTRLSPLAWPEVRTGDQTTKLCLEDLALASGIMSRSTRRYAAQAFLGESNQVRASTVVRLERGSFACTELPSVSGASSNAPRYLIVDVYARSPNYGLALPARVHLYHLGGSDFRIVGLERPDNADPPSG